MRQQQDRGQMYRSDRMWPILVGLTTTQRLVAPSTVVIPMHSFQHPIRYINSRAAEENIEETS